MITLERVSRHRQRHFQGNKRLQALPAFRLKGWRAAAATLVCAAPVRLGFLVPAAVLTDFAVSLFATSWTEEFRGYASNSLMLSFAASVLTVIVGVFLAYGRRLRGGRLLGILVRGAGLGYAMPGAVLAIGVMIPFAAFDNAFDGFMP